MVTIRVQIPEAVLKQAQNLADRENVSVEQIISLAATQAIGVWSSESDTEMREKSADRQRFLNSLTAMMNE